MKIGVLIDRLNVGGVEKIAIEQVKSLRTIGVDATLVVLCKKAVVKGAFSDLLQDVPINYLDERLPRILRFSIKFPLFYFFSSFHVTYPFFLPFVVKKREYDYIISHGTYTSFSAIAFKYIRGIHFSAFIWDPIVYILGRVYTNKVFSLVFKVLYFIAVLLDQMIINATDMILVGGGAHNAYFKKINPHKKIITIYPSVHPAKRIANIKKPYALMVTAWKKGKEPDYIFTLLEKINDLRIVMVGKWLDEDYRSEFIKERNKRKLKDRLEVIGEVDEKELSRYYKEALFLIQTNDDRGFGMPALEAAGHGITFIIPKGQGVCELFKNGKDGYYTKERDTKQIVHYISKLLQNSEQAKDMGRNAWNTVVENYSWKKHAEKLRGVVSQHLYER